MPCPRCHSRNVNVIDPELGMFRCLSCGYNELEESTVADSRKSQREKGRFSQYKMGGKGRVRK